MVDVNKRLVETYEVLMKLPDEDRNKIPQNVIQKIRNNMDKNYKWKYDETKELSEQGLSRDTIAILSYINTEYLLNEEQKNVMKQIYMNNEMMAEREKGKYNSEIVFSNKQTISIDENNRLSIEKKAPLSKLINFIKNLFKKNS